MSDARKCPCPIAELARSMSEKPVDPKQDGWRVKGTTVDTSERGLKYRLDSVALFFLYLTGAENETQALHAALDELGRHMAAKAKERPEHERIKALIDQVFDIQGAKVGT